MFAHFSNMNRHVRLLHDKMVITHKYITCSKCNKVVQVSATKFGEILPLLQVYKSSANFCQFISYLAKCWAYFGKFVTLLALIFNVANSKTLKNNLTCWSHCLGQISVFKHEQQLKLSKLSSVTRFDEILRVNFVFGKIFNLIWHVFDAVGQIFIDVNGEILKIICPHWILSHCQCSLLSFICTND